MVLPTPPILPDSDDDAPPVLFVEEDYLKRALARLRFAQVAERAAIEHATALAAETDAANRDLADARAQNLLLQANIDGLHDRLASRQDFIDVLQARWRRVRTGRSPRQRLARLWRRVSRLNTAAVWVTVLLAALLLLPHLVGR